MKRKKERETPLIINCAVFFFPHFRTSHYEVFSHDRPNAGRIVFNAPRRSKMSFNGERALVLFHIPTHIHTHFTAFTRKTLLVVSPLFVCYSHYCWDASSMIFPLAPLQHARCDPLNPLSYLGAFLISRVARLVNVCT